MKARSWLIICLVGVNAALLGALLAGRASLTPTAQAQALRGGHYMAVSGTSPQGGVVYLYNVDTGVMGGYVYAQANPRNPVAIVPHSITQDIKRVKLRMR